MLMENRFVSDALSIKSADDGNQNASNKHQIEIDSSDFSFFSHVEVKFHRIFFWELWKERRKRLKTLLQTKQKSKEIHHKNG